MEETSFIDYLLLFGLSRQEACIYTCLLKKEELTGYEIAKLTGMSRSNVYNGLAALVEHGAAYAMEGATTKYTAVDVGEFSENYIRRMVEVSELLKKNVPKKELPSQGYFTIEGYKKVCDRIYHMLMGTEKRVYFSAAGDFLGQWEEELKKLAGQGKKVVLLSKDTINWKDIPETMIIYHTSEMPIEDGKEEIHQEQRDQIRLIIDSEFVLTGEVIQKDSATCLYSAQKNFVYVFKDAMRNEIALIQLKNGKTS